MLKCDLYVHIKETFKHLGADFFDTQHERVGTVGWRGRTCLIAVEHKDFPGDYLGQVSIVNSQTKAIRLLDALATQTRCIKGYQLRPGD